jgi:hypothetical protein
MQPLVSISFPFTLTFLTGVLQCPRQLAEALLSLANLTAEEDTREALYARAQVEGGETVRRELAPRPTPPADVRMDES